MRLISFGPLALSLLLFAGCASAPFGDDSGISPFQEWKQIETEHFWISFSEPTSEVAQKFALALEDAHQTLAPILLWEPPKKTQVVLISNTDAANGRAAPQLTPGIVLYTTPPNPHQAINWNDSWVRTLCMHEYTHFLNMDPTRGIYTPLRWLFGDALLPNAAWYPWMLEGYAVFFETRFQGGRGRSSYWNMITRAMIAEQTLNSDLGVTLDRLMLSNPYFPAGETWYLFGYNLVHTFWKQSYLRATAERTGDLGLGLHSQNSSYRVPYLIDDNAAQSIRLGWTDLWTLWLAEAQTRAQAELATLRKGRVTPLQWLVQPSHTESRDVAGPVESPDGKQLAFVAHSTRDWEALWVRDLSADTAPDAPVRLKRLDNVVDATQLSWSPDSQWIAYASMTRFAQYSLYFDLYATRPADGKNVRLTEGERARDPDFSADGRFLTYVRIPRVGYQQLVRTPVIWEQGLPRLGEREVLLEAPLMDRLASARFGHSADQIFFSRHDNGHYSEEIWEWTPTGARSVLAAENVFHRFPYFARKGRFAGQLLYQSDATGVDQIYVRGLGRISHFEIGARMATPAAAASGTLWVSGFSAHGWELARFEALDPALPLNAANEAPVAQADAPPRAESVVHTQSATTPLPETSDYNSLHSLYPRMWSPSVYYASGYFKGSVTFYGNDALDFHRYAAGIGMNSFSFRPDWAASYANRSIGPTLSLTASDQVLGATSSTVSVRNLQLIASASFPFRTTFSSLTPEIAFAAAQDQAYQNGSGLPFGQLIDRGTYTPRLDLGLGYQYTFGSVLSVSAEQGRISQLRARLAAVGGVPVPKFYASHSEYLRVGDSHVVFQPKVDTLFTPVSANVAASETPRVSGFPLSYKGFTSGPYFGPLVGAKNLYQLSLRGYPMVLFASPWAATASLDVRFPIWNIFRGINTLPLTVDRLHGRVFAESAFFPLGDHAPVALPSAGIALELEVKAFTQVPLNLTVQFQNGFITGSGGDQLLLFGLTL